MLSIVVPAYNEAQNLPFLIKRICSTFARTRYEVIVIDDGSTDDSLATLERLKKRHASLKVISFKKNCGQTAALKKGFEKARGDIIISMDADLQNFPEDIPLLIKELRQGYDVVCGWRHIRKDGFFSKILPSTLSNTILNIITGLSINDHGCTLRAYRKEAITGIPLTRQNHRFIPLLLARKGCSISQVKIRHTKRKFGSSNYGLSRLAHGINDLMRIFIQKDN